jgi:hypothetical protein
MNYQSSQSNLPPISGTSEKLKQSEFLAYIDQVVTTPEVQDSVKLANQNLRNLK